MKNLKEIITKKYPNGLDFEFTKEEKAGYLLALKDIEKALAISSVSSSLPSKDDISSLGYNNAVNGRYNYRRVLRDKEQDVYYSGWMDCVDFLNK